MSYRIIRAIEDSIYTAKEFDEIIDRFVYDPLHQQLTFYDHVGRAVRINEETFWASDASPDYICHLFKSGELSFSEAELTELL